MSERARQLRDGSRALTGAVLGVVVLAAAALAWMRLPPERNAVSGTDLDEDVGAAPTVVLVAGVDRRSSEAADLGSLGHFVGAHADALVLIGIDRSRSRVQLVSLPRDLRAHVEGYGDQRLGGFLHYGGTVLLDAVRSVVDVPIHHYAEIDLEGFAAVIDAVGGVELTFVRDARDTVTGFAAPAGRRRLGGRDALAFVRARQYEEQHPDGWVRPDTGDLGRLQRQHRLIAALRTGLEQLGPLERGRALLSAGRHVTVDATLTSSDVIRLSTAVVRAEWRMAVLPSARVVPRSESLSPFPPARWGTGSTLRVVEPAATRLLDVFSPHRSDPHEAVR